MITILGTSHISPNSLVNVRRALREEPDSVAVELDLSRYMSRKRGGKRIKTGVLVRLISKLQKYLGRKTGVFPGEEMFLAIEIARNESIDTYLIDQNYGKTIQVFQSLPIWEKLRLFITPILGLNTGFSIEDIPEEELVEKLLKKVKDQFPFMYEKLIKERDEHMTNALKDLDKRYDNVLAVMGIGHIKGISQLLDKEEINYKIFK
ncbi:MAG: TraB/GumN family protein [Candidatus Aenigmatarchaeota archaeon]